MIHKVETHPVFLVFFKRCSVISSLFLKVFGKLNELYDQDAMVYWYSGLNSGYAVVYTRLL